MSRKKAASERKRAPNGQPMPYQQPDGTWRVDVSLGYDPVTGKPRRHTVRGKTESEVLVKMRKLQVEADEGVLQDPLKYTVKEWCETWIKLYTSHLAEGTLDHYKGYIYNYIIPRLGRYKLKALNRIMVQQFINGITESPLSPGKPVAPKTVHTIHGCLCCLLNLAVESSGLRDNPAARAKLPRVEKQKPRSLDKQEIARLHEND